MVAEPRKRKPQDEEDISYTDESKGDHGFKMKKDQIQDYWDRFCTYLMEPEDASYLAPFRIMWGLVMLLEVWELLKSNHVKLISQYYLNPFDFLFKYHMFEWVGLIDYNLMVIFLWINFAAAIGITIGYQYRLCCSIFFIGVAYLFLLEVTNYLNHMYLVSVISFILIFIPCNRIFSVDAWRNPSIKTDTVPKSFIIIVYAYAGIVKINEDWLRAEPLRHWVGTTDKSIFGEIITYESTAYFMSYGGLVYDLIVGPLLLFPRTFWLGILLSLIFHGSNKILFHIGIFPYVMIASTSLFFNPDWFRRFIHFIKRRKTKLIPVVPEITLRTVKPRKLTQKEKYAIYIVIGFLIFWLLFPSRNLLYSGSVAWNENGHQFSWRMKLRDKNCHADFFIYRPESKTIYEPPDASILLSPIQSRKFVHRPWTVIQYAQFLGKLFRNEGAPMPEVYAYCTCQLNYRPRQAYIDPTVNLVQVSYYNYPHIVTELEPLTEEEKMLFPWKWEWNFNWLRGINNGSNKEKIKQENREIKFDKKQASEENRIAFRKWMAERLDRTFEQVILGRLNPPKPTNKVAAKYWRIQDSKHEAAVEQARQDAINKMQRQV